MVSASSARVDNPVDHQSHDGGFGLFWFFDPEELMETITEALD